MSDKRESWIDAAKGLAIICVVIGHAYMGEPLNTIIYTIHMPFFFIMAGYLLNVNKWGKKKSAFLYSRYKRLLLPYFAGAILFAVLYCIVFNFMLNI